VAEAIEAIEAISAGAQTEGPQEVLRGR